MTWQPGKDRISQLLGSGELERVAPDQAVARRLLADATAPGPCTTTRLPWKRGGPRTEQDSRSG
jgi:hypothetical protein